MAAGRTRARPAQVALGLVTAYTLVMLVLGQVGRGIVRTQLAARGVEVTGEPMVAPVFASVDRRYTVAEAGPNYLVSGFRWWPTPALDGGTRLIARNADHPAVSTARGAPEARGFLGWSRFPFFVVEPDARGFTVIMDDARYAPPSGESWAAVRVHVPAAAVGSGGNAPGGGNRLTQVLARILKAVPCV